MGIGTILQGLKDTDGNAITSMGSDWTTQAYDFGDFLHLGIHLFWSDATIQGVLYVEYSCDPIGNNDTDVVDWVENNAINLDGTFSRILVLDANLPISTFRLRYERVAGTAGLTAYIQRKRGR